MARYIDADKLREYWLDNGVNENVYNTNNVLDSIDYQPTADVVEVKDGEWIAYETEEIYGDDGSVWYKCSVCGTDALGRCYEDEWYSYPIKSDFCHKCGADLRTPKERGGEK